jgi:HPt (histidine-containing phosphotransfer) domain-containing protein
MESQDVPNPAQHALKLALDRMWQQFLPVMSERVAILEDAAASLASSHLTAEEQENARGAAHKLAGALGTFGLTEGTSLAREAEIALSSEIAGSPAFAERLATIAAALRAMIANPRP